MQDSCTIKFKKNVGFQATISQSSGIFAPTFRRTKMGSCEGGSSGLCRTKNSRSSWLSDVHSRKYSLNRSIQLHKSKVKPVLKKRKNLYEN